MKFILIAFIAASSCSIWKDAKIYEDAVDLIEEVVQDIEDGDVKEAGKEDLPAKKA